MKQMTYWLIAEVVFLPSLRAQDGVCSAEGGTVPQIKGPTFLECFSFCLSCLW